MTPKEILSQLPCAKAYMTSVENMIPVAIAIWVSPGPSEGRIVAVEWDNLKGQVIWDNENILGAGGHVEIVRLNEDNETVNMAIQCILEDLKKEKKSERIN